MGSEIGSLIQKLAANLPPVQRIPRLRWVAGRVLLLAAATTALGLLVLGPRADLFGLVGRDLGFSAALAGLVLVGVGGVLAGLAAAVPGRELLWRVGLGLGVAGVLIPAGVGALLLASGLAPAEPPLRSDAACLATSYLLALPAALAVLAFVARGAATRPGLAALAAASGAVAIGAIALHLTCPYDGLRHVLLAHALAPVSGGLLLGTPLSLAVRRALAVARARV